MCLSTRRSIAFLSMVTLLMHPGLALAYFDPNAGGMLFQLLMPVFAAIVGAWLFLRRWIADFFRRFWSRLTGKARE